MAASKCTPTTNFDGLTVGSCPSVVNFAPDTAVTATLAYGYSSTSFSHGNTCKVSRTKTNPAWNYIELDMRPGTRNVKKGDYIQVTITMSQPVSDLSFLLHDIDSTSGYIDTVVVVTPDFTYQRGSNIQGSGTGTDPFRPITLGDTPIDSGDGRLRLKWAGPVTTVTFRYVAGQDFSYNQTNQHIGLGDIQFNACVFSENQAQSRLRGVSQLTDTGEVRPTILATGDKAPKLSRTDGNTDL